MGRACFALARFTARMRIALQDDVLLLHAHLRGKLGHNAVTSAITTKPVPIEAFVSPCPSLPQVRDMAALSTAMMSLAASSTSTSALPDGGPRPSAALDHLHIGLGRARR